MKQSITAFLVLVLVFAVVGSTLAQPTAKIVIRGGSPGLIKAFPKEFNTSSNGLPNVGKGSKVWLEAKALRGTVPTTLHYDTLTAVAWSVIKAPSGSVATIQKTDTANGLMGSTAMFIPDMVGTFQIGLTVTTANGMSAEATMYINAANYVGVGTIVGGSADPPECAGCHDGSDQPDKVTPWKGTAHSTMFSNGIDGKIIENGAPFYMASCISCHTTGYDKTSTAVNGGFDDRALQYGWKFPDTLRASNWDSMKVNYPDVAKLANIQCESCHGPGSRHSSRKGMNQIAVTWSAEMCGQCHDAPTHHAKSLEWENSLHATSTMEGTNIEYMNRDPCAQCHTAQGFVDVTIDAGALHVPYANVQPVNCIGCHDPHSAKNPAQLRRASLADACTGCHMTRVSSRGLHTSLQGPMLAGSTATPFSNQLPPAGGIGFYSGWQLPGYMYPNSAHTGITDKCVVCHMAAVPADSLIGKLGDHTFKVAYDVDSTRTIFNTNGCVCHGTGGAPAITQQYVEDSQTEIKDLLAKLASLLPQSKGVVRAHTDTSYHAWTPIQMVGAYNYYFVTNDGSFGVHNHGYAKALLLSTMDQLTMAVGAAPISSVKDVPNDQGRQVQIVWNMFPVERNALDPVKQYGVWRQDPMSSVTAADAKATSFREMLARGTAGSRYVLGGSVWTYVGYVPAAKQSMYSYDAPTIVDSTVFNGMHWTMFYITGITNSGMVYSSAPDSGYSIDNLAPAPPTGLGAMVVSNAVQLGWKESLDPDFKYFAVYRGTSPDFDPHSTQAIGTVSKPSFSDANVAQGTTYYYKLSAVDFSGNESKYSIPVSAVVSGVSDVGGVPREFALNQNYPNPFNPWTEIKYQVPQASHVKVTVYNTLGVLVATLVDRNEEAGYYNVTWDGNDSRGNVVASGIYLYKMEAGSFSVVKKMVFMK